MNDIHGDVWVARIRRQHERHAGLPTAEWWCPNAVRSRPERTEGARYAEARRGASKMRETGWRRMCEAVPRRFTSYDVYTGKGDHPTIKAMYEAAERFAPGFGARHS